MRESRQYELIYIVTPEATEETLAGLHAQIEAIVTRFEGTIDATEHWGRRRLAYEIARQKEGIYVLELITGSGDLIKEIDRRLKVVDDVIRHLVVRVDEDMRIADLRKASREAAAAKRRAARGLPPEAPASEAGADAVRTETASESEVSHE